MNPATTVHVDANTLRFNVQTWGAPSNPPLVMLHGLASTSHMFDLLAPLLADRFYIVAPDQRGHGQSDKPDNGYDFETLVQDVEAIIVAMGLTTPVRLAGHSWGAFTALYAAAARPALVEKMVMIDGGLRAYGEIYPEWDIAYHAMTPPEYENQTVDDIQAMIRNDWLGAAYRPELMPLVLSIYDTSDPNNVHAHLVEANHVQIIRALWQFRPADVFARVACPTQIVNAVESGQTADTQVMIYSAEAERQMRDAEVVWMADTIHDIPWQRPAELAALLQRFL